MLRYTLSIYILVIMSLSLFAYEYKDYRETNISFDVKVELDDSKILIKDMDIIMEIEQLNIDKRLSPMFLKGRIIDIKEDIASYGDLLAYRKSYKSPVAGISSIVEYYSTSTDDPYSVAYIINESDDVCESLTNKLNSLSKIKRGIIFQSFKYKTNHCVITITDTK